MPLPDGVRPLSVSALTNSVRVRLEELYVDVWVTGELANYTQAASMHQYFTLKDEKAQLRCMMPRGFGNRIRFRPHDGLGVIARGTLTMYPPRGDAQLTVEELHPKGIGAAELALRQLKESLRAKGYFDPARKRPLPRYPRLVALVTSQTSDAIRDMLELLAQRWPLARVVVRHSRVQGEGAAADVAAQLRLLSDLHRKKLLPLCAVVLGRGGGSATDLSAFNEECVADAIYESAVPVVSAIGHETDVTIADLVADRRAETPSAAIVLLVPHCDELHADLTDRRRRLHDVLLTRVRHARQRLGQLADRPAFRKPLDRVRELGQRVDDADARLGRAARQGKARAADRLAQLAEQLEALSPLAVLRRGYSLTRRGDGAVVRRAADVAPGEVLSTRVAGGDVLSRVLSVRETADDPGP